MKTILLALSIFMVVRAGRIGKAVYFDGAIGGEVVKPPIFLENGNVGVNFAGYHASAGLGGLVSGDTAGGLHAEAGTPFGQEAAAGLGGAVESSGKVAGGLYAGATAGGGVAAETELVGSQSASGSTGESFGAASAGGSVKYASKTVHKPVIVEREVHTAPVVQKSYVERTVIPNYVEKTIQVPSYVEKTVRVPTVVEKTIRVPAPPTIIEKTIEVPAPVVVQKTYKPASFAANVNIESQAAGGEAGQVTVIEKGNIHPVHGGFGVHKYGGFGGGYGNAGLFGGLFARAGLGGNTGYNGGGVYRTSFTKTANPGFINDVFNIPISTLGAVNRLVSGIVGGTSGSVAISKHYGYGAY